MDHGHEKRTLLSYFKEGGKRVVVSPVMLLVYLLWPKYKLLELRKPKIR
jgi:hypothetical protein